MTDPYKVLGLPAAASEEMLRARYQELKTRYSEDRFLEGEAGNEGARRLMELEDAWAMIQADISMRQNPGTGDLGTVEALIRKGDYAEAQRVLDSIAVRTAEWHYLQSIIYYKREWLTESRNQLQMAIQMDSNNMKYHEALNRLNGVMGNPHINPQSVGQDGNFNHMHGGRPMDTAGDTLCRCCQAWLCAECFCCMLRACC